MKTETYGGIKYEIPDLSSNGLEINTESLIPSSFPVEAFNTQKIWDLRFFETPIIPTVIETVKDETLFSGAVCPRILDMPIKFPKNNFRIPSEAGFLKEMIVKAASHQLALDPISFDDLYCYLTVDKSFIKAGNFHRNPGVHCDGLQGKRIYPKVPVNTYYLVTDDPNSMTGFYHQPFKVRDLNPARHNFFLEFGRQAREDSMLTFKPYEVVLFNAYNVHRSAVVLKDTYRTCVRLNWTVRKYDRLGNTHNPMFNYKWKMVERPVPPNLI